MNKLEKLFSKDGIYKLSKSSNCLLLNGQVFIPKNPSRDVVELCANICGRLGFEAVGYDLPIVKIYTKEDDIEYPCNIFINCGPFIESCGISNISFTKKDDKMYFTLSGEMSTLPYGFFDTPLGEYTDAKSLNTKFDLADILSCDGFYKDQNKDFISDEFLGKVILNENITDKLAIEYCHICARLGSETSGLTLPMTSFEKLKEGEGFNIILEENSSSISLIKNDLLIGEDAVDYFIKHFPYIDKKNTVSLDEFSRDLEKDEYDKNKDEEHIIFGVEKTLDIWEKDEVINLFKEHVYPLIKEDDKVELICAISEEKNIRFLLEDEIKSLIYEKSAKGKVNAICAYKQGLSFIEECIIPEISDVHEISEIVIGFKPLLKDKDEPWDLVKGDRPNYGLYEDKTKWFDLPIRFLQELYPIDDIIELKTGLSRDKVVFKALDFDNPNTYEIDVYDKDKNKILSKNYSVKLKEKPYLEEYPETGIVHVSEGFVKASINGKVILDVPVNTDLEMFFEEYHDILNKVKDHIIKENRDRVECQPFFKLLKVEVFASEPDFSLECRQDVISSLDALHEDIYFVGLDFFKRFGIKSCNKDFNEPGLILPVIHKREGKNLTYRVTLIEQKSLNFDKTEFSFYKLDIKDNLLEKLYYKTSLGDKKEILITKNDAKPKEFNVKDALKDINSHIVGYDEYMDIVDGLKDLEGVKITKIGKSLENRDIYAFCFYEDLGVEVVSHVKLINSKPAYYINNRHHANEVSSTNSAFDLIFKLLIDEDYKRFLDHMNIIIVPMENVDGTEIGFMLQKDNPRFILHPARYNSIGREFYFDYFSDKIGECQALPYVWRKWLPDFLVDNHGVPTHEWVQQFSGYVSPWFRGFWLPRGIFYGYCMYVDDDNLRYYFEEVARAVSSKLDENEDILRINNEFRDRHTKYAYSFMPNMYPQDYMGNFIFYFAGVPQNPENNHPHIRYPWITTMEWITEIADETAQGDYLKLCSKTHKVADLAVLELIAKTQVEVLTKGIDLNGKVKLQRLRKRPVKM